jgi:protein ImuB
MSSTSKTRQVVAVYLHSILSELVSAKFDLSSQLAGKKSRPVPRAVVWLKNPLVVKSSNRVLSGKTPQPYSDSSSDGAELNGTELNGTELNGAELNSEEFDAKTPLDAVNAIASQYGVKIGQTIAEARALVANLQVVPLTHQELLSAVERVAEVLGRFGTTVAFELPDVVWVDVTGSAHLFGGPASTLDEIRMIVEELGHHAHAAMSDGPLLSKAFARWETRRRGLKSVIVSPEEKQRCIQALPTTCLPLETDVKISLAQLGILSLGDLMAIEPSVVSSRLGNDAQRALGLLQGDDNEPLCAYRPMDLPHEVLEWDEPAPGNEPILFALRRLTTQVAARLKGRGMAAETLCLTLKGDAALARFRNKPLCSKHELQLAAPLSRADDLWRVLVARVNKIQVDVPTVGVTLEVLAVQEAKQRQLDLAVGFSKIDASDSERLAVLFGELAADIGAQSFGVLRLADSHKPEKVTLLSPVAAAKTLYKRGKRRSRPRESSNVALENLELPTLVRSGLGMGELPNRLLSQAMPVNGRFRVGDLLPLGQQLYTIAQVKFQRRLDAVEWWSKEPCSRDYVQLVLTSTSGQLQVLAYVDRITQQRYIQGWYD